MFLFTGSFSKSTLGLLKMKGDAGRLERRFDDLLGDYGGRLIKFYFQPGDVGFFGIADVPRHVSTRWVYAMIESGLLADGTFQMNKVRVDPAEIDTELQRADALDQPFPTTANRAG